MTGLRCTLGLLALMVVFITAEEKRAKSASERIEEVNRNIVRAPDGLLIQDDMIYESESGRNADPCTSYNCKWDQASDGMVYVPFIIADHYTSRERAVIERGLQSFHSVSCIRFIPRTGESDFIHIQSLDGCYSYVGRRFNEQALSLKRQGCLYHDVVQHELLHALGFKHEQCRSDRDQHIRILWENVIPGWEYAFDKINTLNQGTAYDYNSVMQYSRYAFSKNNQPTMVPIPDPSVDFGMATEMSQTDLTRLNRLYNCR
ncbi:high choriolytic enzyme 1-like [Toxotes jaculatrix]|uniref:high choriolytic enzyme 1-like n=1 Tax=Toxotes jaculatrix TaxID=941984 RepID=UPI001B3A8682|nr:high choriolytic enzyme 1-like [Toxotes jaculatrix]XP_040894699.1 high choriolytic enzyme 1-like [Toxotes jaculatrix]